MIKKVLLIFLPIFGLIGGSAFAAWQIRSGANVLSIENGPWRTADNIGSAEAGLHTRAVVALQGLLGLPDSEAIYYNAIVDSAGDALDGSCTYRVSGGQLPTRWWSITAYADDNYLIPNDTGYYSVGSGQLTDDLKNNWVVSVAPDNIDGAGLPWIPVAIGQNFQLMLRAYHPEPELLNDRETVSLPRIEKKECAQ